MVIATKVTMQNCGGIIYGGAVSRSLGHVQLLDYLYCDSRDAAVRILDACIGLGLHLK